ncbi:MAG: methyltransferase domain-containing protein [Nostoc sp.]|uniref:class I SAM-dependent methyltransferase n=1 Tax=Nostoc sp. TaxID=1180 RepID=UPI002FEEDF50
MYKISFKKIVKQILPDPIYRQFKGLPPAKGMVNFGSFRRLKPISSCYGFDRGQPIGRYYGENFLARHADDVRGHVLEIGDSPYTRKFGGDRVTKSDVLHLVEGNPETTIIGDLTNAPHIPDNTFDCFILYQTLQLIYDLPAAIKTTYRILKPGGVVLVSIPGIIQIADPSWNDYWCWSFTTASAQQLFAEVFPKDNITIEAFGNVLAAISALQGMAAEELRPEELNYKDPAYTVSITVRAVKPNTIM